MKKKTWSASSISSLLIVLAIIVVVNLIGLRLFARADLTENKIYTLSAASRRVVGGLEDRMTIKAYFTKNLPPPYNANARYVEDALEDYRSYSKGNLAIEFVDPADEAELEAEAGKYRIQPVQVNVLEKDNVQLKKAYMGLVLIYGDKHETIPLIQTVDNFEYEVTSAVIRLTSEKMPKVGFLGNFGTPDLGQALRTITTALSKHYEVVPVNTKSGNSLIDPSIDVLCVVSPTEALDEWTKFCLDQYVMQGGKVGWFVNKTKADVQTSMASAAQLNIDDLTRQWGFIIANNLVCDLNASMINVQQQQGFFTITNLVRYPSFPEIRDFNQQSPIVKDFQTLNVFFPSSIDTMQPSNGHVEFTPLFSTSEATKVQVRSFDINPMGQPKREEYTGGKKLLGVTLQGTFGSAFVGRPAPPPSDSLAGPPSVQIVTQSPESRMVVIGDGNFAQGQYSQQGGPGMILFLNAVDWLSQDNDLISIRSREAAIRPLKPDITDATKRTVKIANMIGPPALVLLFGMFRWTARRNRTKGAAL
ncbi:Gldg family protein [candidate division KSB1 bacterium]|nr:Gldg family protein [candidate division KSB1 bacterium]